MIRVDRGNAAEPASLKSPRGRRKLTELELARAHMSGPRRNETYDFTAYKEADVKRALHQLFHGKCAYCESFYAKTQPVDVEHYRPKGAVDGAMGHPGYWWLAMDWENLLPSCIDCNRKREQITPDVANPSLLALLENGDFNRWKKISTGKQSAFPLATGSPRAAGEADDIGSERRLLVDPTRDDPQDHLAFYVDRENLVSLVYPKPSDGAEAVLPPATIDLVEIETGARAGGFSAAGAVSIQVYGLNRLSLVQARTRTIRDLEFLLEMSLGLTELLLEMEERIERLRANLQSVSGTARVSLVDDLDFLQRASDKIRGFRDRTWAQMGSMTSPSAPHSATARAWIRKYLRMH